MRYSVRARTAWHKGRYCLSYRVYSIRHSEWNYGYIHEGAEVRIGYKGEDILCVEVK